MIEVSLDDIANTHREGLPTHSDLIGKLIWISILTSEQLANEVKSTAPHTGKATRVLVHEVQFAVFYRCAGSEARLWVSHTSKAASQLNNTWHDNPSVERTPAVARTEGVKQRKSVVSVNH